jgi:hypothetical protein
MAVNRFGCITGTKDKTVGKLERWRFGMLYYWCSSFLGFRGPQFLWKAHEIQGAYKEKHRIMWKSSGVFTLLVVQEPYIKNFCSSRTYFLGVHTIHLSDTMCGELWLLNKTCSLSSERVNTTWRQKLSKWAGKCVFIIFVNGMKEYAIYNKN